MSNRTPGSWRVSREYNGTFIRAAHGGLVASCEAGSRAMRNADVSLIAAAPELLGACEALIYGDDLQVAIDKARAAITKARGG